MSGIDTITYFTLIAGVIRAGYTVFPISPRNSAQAIAHLLAKTDTSHLFVGAEASLQELAAASLDGLSRERDAKLPKLSTMPLFEDLYLDDHETTFKPLPSYKPDWNDSAFIVHSSGAFSLAAPGIHSNDVTQGRLRSQSPSCGLIIATLCSVLRRVC